MPSKFYGSPAPEKAPRLCIRRNYRVRIQDDEAAVLEELLNTTDEYQATLPPLYSVDGRGQTDASGSANSGTLRVDEQPRDSESARSHYKELNHDYVAYRHRRRLFLRNTGVGLGSMALDHCWRSKLVRRSPSRNGRQHSADAIETKPRIIWLYMAGGMTHIDTFDNKPKLAELHGKPMPESVTKGQQIAYREHS
ncbi:MAG: DUF1501 domain-containing protein [Planctomycetaceae bacterium]